MIPPPVPYCSPYIPAPTAADGSPLAFDPAWRSETVLNLAKGIEAERNYTRLPILADALEEAGCDVFEILDHCRRCDGHHRGCWVMKLVLDRDPLVEDPFTDPEVIAMLRQLAEESPATRLICERLETGHRPGRPATRLPILYLLAPVGLFALFGWWAASQPKQPKLNTFQDVTPLLTTPTFDHRKWMELGEQVAPKTRPTG